MNLNSDALHASHSDASHADSLAAINGHLFTRSFRYWASNKVGPTPDSNLRIASTYFSIGRALGCLPVPMPEVHVDMNLFNMGCRLIADGWQTNFHLLRFDELRNSLPLLTLPAQTIFYHSILNHGVHTKMKPQQTTLPPDIVNKLTMALAHLEQALLAKDPMMPQHLRASHQLLISYPETVHLLDDDEIARLISAAQVHTGIEIVKLNTPRSTKKKITADDL